MRANDKGSGRRTQQGVTLVELVMAIVILAGALLGILAAINQATAKSADPVLQMQSQAIARAYLDEILAMDFTDPDGSEAGENRATYDDVDDYDALSNNGCLTTTTACPTLGACVCDQTGAPIGGLAGYAVNVTVANSTLGAVGMLRVDVLVTHPSEPRSAVMFTGYKGNY